MLILLKVSVALGLMIVYFKKFVKHFLANLYSLL